MRTVGIALVFLALVIAVVPALTDCQSQGRSLSIGNGRTVPMKCHWTAMAAIALALPLAGVGGLLAARPRQDNRALSVVGALLGVAVVLLPTALIGVCAANDMLCNMIMRPTLILGGSLVSLLSAGTLFLNRRAVGMVGQPA